jgi:MFS family permease
MVGPFVSALANRYGFRTVCILGSALGGIGFALSCLANSVTFLYLSYGVLGGIGFGLVYVPAVIAVGFYFERWRALATGIAVCGSGIGTFLMAPLCTLLISTYGWRGALLIQAGLILNCAVFGTLFRPLKPIKVALPQPDVDVETDAQKKSSAEQLPLLFRIKMARDDLMKKCDSLGSFADNASVTAEPKTGSRSRFLKTSNNNKYPTATQVLVRSTTALSGQRRPSSHSLNAQTNSLHASNTSTASPPRSRKRLSGSSYTDAVQQEEESKPVLAVNAVPEDVTLKRVPTCNEILKPVEEERRGSDETTEILEEADRVMIIQAANKAGKRTRHTSECSCKSRDVGVRPLYRDDIFFGGSLQKLPQYTSQNSVGYHMSVTRLPSKKDVMEEVNQECRLCPEAVRRTVTTMLDMSLLRSPTFLLLAVSGFITMMGFYVPFMYMTDRAEVSGMETSKSVWLVSTIGITNTIGRVVCGVVSSLPGVDALLINNAALTIGGLVTIISGLSLSFGYQIFYSTVFGLAIACFASLRSILIVELMGLDKLTNAFGLLLLFQGIAAVIGSPIAGLFFDATGSYDASFYLSGSLILVSGILCYPLKRLNAWEMQKSKSRAESNI